MTEQTEALRLAEYMDAPLNNPADVADAAAAELRRLSAVEKQRDALLGMLKNTRAFINSVAPHGGLLERVDAAIAKAEGQA